MNVEDIIQKIESEISNLEEEVAPTYCGEEEYLHWEIKNIAKQEVLKEFLHSITTK